ncbi:hypothetical protein ONS96_005944 [Cadophora gregata f. sp. sojae]|nr:hypothetical protein ONS96_005944 [Cadophora gregata f. sp. sojae]
MNFTTDETKQTIFLRSEKRAEQEHERGTAQLSVVFCSSHFQDPLPAPLSRNEIRAGLAWLLIASRPGTPYCTSPALRPAIIDRTSALVWWLCGTLRRNVVSGMWVNLNQTLPTLPLFPPVPWPHIISPEILYGDWTFGLERRSLTLPGRLGWDCFASLIRRCTAGGIRVGWTASQSAQGGMAWHGLQYDVVEWGPFLSLFGRACKSSLFSSLLFSHRTAAPDRWYAMASHLETAERASQETRDNTESAYSYGLTSLQRNLASGMI